jgi:hypothetical protein
VLDTATASPYDRLEGAPKPKGAKRDGEVMSRKLGSRLLLVSVVASVGVAGGASAAQAAPIPTEVVYEGSECSSMDHCIDFGRLESSKARCRSDRKVKGIDQSDQVFDTDRSSDNGAWALLRRSAVNGFDRVRAPKKEFEGKRDCAGDTAFIP